MASFFGCGFARIAVKRSFTKPTGKVEYDQENRLKNYLAVFHEHQERYEVDQHSYTKRSKSLVHHFGKWKLKTIKDKYTEHFSPNNWEKLTEHEKKQHTRTNCKACDVHHFSYQSLFPKWSYKENSITQQGVDKNINSRILKPSRRGNVKVTKKAMKTATSQIYQNINAPLKNIFGVTFANAQTNVSELSLQVKKSHAEMKNERRKKSKVDKSCIQEKWSEKDCDTMLATRQTYSQRQEQRLNLFFESPEDAEQRANKRKRQEEDGQCKKKRHSPRPEDLDFDKDGLLEKVNTMRDGERINYSELARQYGVMEKTKLGNMVVKEFLESKGVQLSRFQQFRQNTSSARRKLNRMQGGEISVPIPRTNNEIKETLMSKIESGEFILGEMIVPQTFKKVLLTKEGNYEVLPTEPLHDVKEHISNVFTELPSHLDKDEKIAFQDIIECAFAGKEKLRGCDYRLAAVIVAQYLRGKVRPNIQTLLDSLTELSKLLYLPAQSRSPKLVLRLHNQAFIHAMICKDVIGQPKSLTSRKFYGRYWHSITAHAGKQSRIISAKSTNTEEEERHFNTLQGVTRLTSRRPGDIITPSLIRLQAEQKLSESKQGNTVKEQQSQISKYYSTLPPFPNTTLHNRYIINNPKEYQAHLQAISDFIACGEGVWWHQILSGVEFFDGPNEPNTRPQGPTLHHFRSSDLKREEQHLNQCWERCLNDDAIVVPHRIIRLYDQRGDCTKIIRTNFLHRENDESHADSTPDQQEGTDDASDLEQQQEYPDMADDDESGEETDVGESAEEVTGLEELHAPVDYTDDEDEDDYEVSELQTLAAPSTDTTTRIAGKLPQNKDDTYRNSHSRTKSPPQAKEIKTKLCKNIVMIVGETDCLYKLDTARQNLKEHPTNDLYKSNYESLLAPVQTQILARRTSLKKQHKEWEKQFYLSHDCSEPTLDEIRSNKEQYSIYKNMLLCEELLKYWKITVHL